ncbi:Alpha/Beta hydrolase protein [Cytidiella melzeri]|nr:Alpha/Beta hydrolase protein [Cytidiella melzeri]
MDGYITSDSASQDPAAMTPPLRIHLAFSALLVFVSTCRSQSSSSGLPNSFPQDYPGKPAGIFSPEWQNYFLVEEGSLPNVSFPLSRNWAGNIPVNRTNHPNDTLFFWAFEHANGSFTQDAGSGGSDEPWAIWLNGGPGESSLVGMLLENGPLRIAENGSIIPNNASWDKLVDFVWVDQPVGTGYSTVDANGGYIQNEDEMGEDFLSFLSNLVKIFPSLTTRPLLLTGSSYAGTFIPYITKTIFSTPSPPVNLSKIAIGNGAMGSSAEFEILPTLSLIETYPQLIGYDPEVYQYFKEQTHLCGFDLNLTYPQTAKFPPVLAPQQPEGSGGTSHTPALVRKRLAALARDFESTEMIAARRNSLLKREETAKREERRQSWLTMKRSAALNRRDLSGRANGTIDPFYGCFLSNELQEYALNFSMPWNISKFYDVYKVEDLRETVGSDPTVFMNDNRTRAALHAPTSVNWTYQIDYPFGSVPNRNAVGILDPNPLGDPSVEPVAFFDELASNASAHGVQVIIYAGNDDTIVPPLSSEIIIQNTTFGGIQGFTQRPSTPWSDDSGAIAGIVHQERNWTYILIANAGHQVPADQPDSALVMFREFILGSNTTGLLTNSSTTTTSPPVLMGPNNVLPGGSAILYGSGKATSVYVAPSATIAAWNTFFASVASSESAAAATGGGGGGGGSSSDGLSIMFRTRGVLGGWSWTVLLGMMLAI